MNILINATNPFSYLNSNSVDDRSSTVVNQILFELLPTDRLFFLKINQVIQKKF